MLTCFWGQLYSSHIVFVDLFFGVDALEDVFFAGPFHQLPRGDVELSDERVVAAAVVVEALHLNVAILKDWNRKLISCDNEYSKSINKPINRVLLLKKFQFKTRYFFITHF